MPINRKLTLSVLGKKLAILLTLAAPKRVSEIARLDRRCMSKKKNSVNFDLPGLSKTQKKTVNIDQLNILNFLRKNCVLFPV